MLPTPTVERKPKTHPVLPEGYYLPDESDIFPIQLPNRLQRRVVFYDALRWFGKPHNWARSLDQDAVLKYIRENTRSKSRRFTLSDRALRSIANTVSRYCFENLKDGRTQAGLSERQSKCGIKSGENRRKRNEQRDNAIVRAVLSGESISVVARKYGRARSTIRDIIKRRA